MEARLNPYGTDVGPKFGTLDPAPVPAGSVVRAINARVGAPHHWSSLGRTEEQWEGRGVSVRTAPKPALTICPTDRRVRMTIDAR